MLPSFSSVNSVRYNILGSVSLLEPSLFDKPIPLFVFSSSKNLDSYDITYLSLFLGQRLRGGGLPRLPSDWRPGAWMQFLLYGGFQGVGRKYSLCFTFPNLPTTPD